MSLKKDTENIGFLVVLALIGFVLLSGVFPSLKDAFSRLMQNLGETLTGATYGAGKGVASGAAAAASDAFWGINDWMNQGIDAIFGTHLAGQGGTTAVEYQPPSWTTNPADYGPLRDPSAKVVSVDPVYYDGNPTGDTITHYSDGSFALDGGW